MSDLVVQFARLWGQREAFIFNAKDEATAGLLKGYDSDELFALLQGWAEDYLAQDEVEDSVDFFESKIEQMYVKEFCAGSVRFECNCETDVDLAEMLDETHKAKPGFNFEIGARLWFTPDRLGKTIMVEYDMTTQECRDLVENQDEPDWFTAYEVDDEQDYDCSVELFTDTCDNHISLSGLKDAMGEFARRVYMRCYDLEAKLVDAKERVQDGSVKGKSEPERTL